MKINVEYNQDQLAAAVIVRYFKDYQTTLTKLSKLSKIIEDGFESYQSGESTLSERFTYARNIYHFNRQNDKREALERNAKCSIMNFWLSTAGSAMSCAQLLQKYQTVYKDQIEKIDHCKQFYVNVLDAPNLEL